MSTKKNKLSAALKKCANRRERWHLHIIERLDAIKDCEAYIPREWLEEIEGRPMDEVILDWICSHNGYGLKNLNAQQQYRHEYDEYCEKLPTISRNCHERDEAHFAVFEFLEKMSGRTGLDGEQLRAFIRKFYHAGDCGLGNAIHRSIAASMGTAA